MKKILFLTLLLTGCVAVPIEQKFPEAPETLKQACPQLEDVPAGATKLSEILTVVINNYALYHECQIKVDTWNDWYTTQQSIYNK